MAYEIDNASAGEHLDVIKWIAEHNVGGGECSSEAMDNAAENGHLHVVQWLHEKLPDDVAHFAIDIAAKNGHLDIVKWLFKRRSESCTVNALPWAAQLGHFDVVLFLYAKLGASCLLPNTIEVRDECIAHMEMVQWLYDKNPMTMDLDTLRMQAGCMPAVLQHILELSPPAPVCLNKAAHRLVAFHV